MLNLYGSALEGFVGLLTGTILFFTPVYRPTGGLVYLTVFTIAGLNNVARYVLCA
jgi:hypothetical protein